MKTYCIYSSISRTPTFSMKKQGKNFLNIIPSLQSHSQDLKTIKVITAAVLVLK